MAWDQLADEEVLEKTIEALKGRGIEVFVANNGAEAKEKVQELIPKDAEVMEASSTTLDEIGVTEELENSGKYVAMRNKIRTINDPIKRDEERRKSVACDYGVGSVHAITEDGQIVLASKSGSQVGLYAYGAKNVILVVGTQKIVKNIDDAFKRIYDYVLPLESERVRKAYGMQSSSVNKILIIERENPDRIKLLFVKEKLGF